MPFDDAAQLLDHSNVKAASLRYDYHLDTSSTYGGNKRIGRCRLSRGACAAFFWPPASAVGNDRSLNEGSLRHGVRACAFAEFNQVPSRACYGHSFNNCK